MMDFAHSQIPDPAFVDAVARRVVELLETPIPGAETPRVGRSSGSRSLTVAQVAARYGVSRSWVYAHQRELRAMRLGAGPRARLRFDSDAVSKAIAAFEEDGSQEQPGGHQRRRGREMPLIPFEPMG